MTERDVNLCAGGCAYCVGAGGYEDHDGTWQVCSWCHGAPCDETCLCPEPTDNTQEERNAR